MSEKNQTKLIAFRLGLAEYEQLSQVAQVEGKNPTEIARQAVRDRLNGDRFIDIARREIREVMQEIVRAQAMHLEEVRDAVFQSAEHIQLIAVGDVSEMRLHIGEPPNRT
jgi:hypothetical protein